MAERKATNKYYPPDWDPSKGSINRHNKSHPLRDRARKISDGILVVRFEMPFNIWCSKCDNHIGMGVRFNAEKTKVGNYYTSPIYKFRMKCHLCDNHFEIQTNPSKFEYIIISGARKHIRLPDPADEDLNQTVIDDEERKRRLTDAMYRLEKQVVDKIESEASLPSLQGLKHWRSLRQDSFSTNQLLRKQYRDRRKRIETTRTSDLKLLKKTSLKISLVKSNPNDAELAKAMYKQSQNNRVNDQEAAKRKQLLCPNAPSIVKSKLRTESFSSNRTDSTRIRLNCRLDSSTGKIKLEPT